jgi:hypothetical protein
MFNPFLSRRQSPFICVILARKILTCIILSSFICPEVEKYVFNESFRKKDRWKRRKKRKKREGMGGKSLSFFSNIA